MQNTMRKILSAVLVCMLFLGMMPAAALPAAADSQLTSVSAWNLVLADEIAVNFHVSISDAAAEDAVMVVTDGYGVTEYPIAEAEKNADGLYRFTGYLAAAQLTDEVTLQLISGEEAGPVHSYSAAQYAQTVLAGDYSQSTKDLILSMLHYGAAAQVYFGYHTDKLANAGYGNAEVSAIPETAASDPVSGNVSGISCYGASLLYQSRIAVRFYFSVSGNVADYTFTAGGKVLEPAAKDGRYYVDVPGINPQNYDKAVAVQVSDGTDTMTVSYSPMTYIVRKHASSSDALKALVGAMYQYHVAAKAYLSVSGDVTTDGNGIVTEQITLQGSQSSAVVAAGTQLEENTTTLTLSTIAMNQTGSDVVLSENEQMVSMDVHVEGIAKSNTVPVLVTLDELAPEFLNQGNISLYHVENGETVEMTRVYSASELDAHNEYYYDIVTGTVTVALASFSEIVVRSNNENAWNGDYDYSWYDEEKTELTIANADQLAGFSAIVGGMDGQAQDSFDGKTVKLIADISIGDTDSENGIVFYPIGYYNSEGTYGKTGTAITSGFYEFHGTFDGQGHTVSDFYQNTWEMKGDNEYYAASEQNYRDGMGLFGKVYGGTVKNLTVKNFSSDGEFTTTGTVAAYADCGAKFENIAIFDCNPRVYNIGNGGIVGCVGWYTKDETQTPVTFTNITVDNSNKISALWGSWDVACGGLVGQYYPTSGQNDIKNAGVHFENCHVAAQIDVYNDVCANYQYYAYRYAGMLIGSVRENVNGEDGRVYPNMDGITAANCTVHYGTWNDYYYCELVANSLASYTHDHQMSRLEQVDSVDVENKTVTVDGETTAIPTSGRYNYVVVKGEHATENAICYHFVDGAVWNHEKAGEETVDGETVLKEDKQHLYLEFYDQLVTGYGWGVTSKGIADIPGVTVLDREVAESVEKFEAKVEDGASYVSGSVVNVGDLFQAVELPENVTIDTDNVQVFVSPADETSTVSGTYAANTSDWTKGVLILTGVGAAEITITDYNYCKETVLTVNVTEPAAGTAFYKKVTETPADWSGKYLIVYEDGKVAFNGDLDELDAEENKIAVAISSDGIVADDTTNAAAFTIAAVEGGYFIQSASGKFIGQTTDANGLAASDNAYTNTISLEDGVIHIVSGGAYLRFNAASNQNRFRYYKSSSYTAQKAIALYKHETGTVCTHEGANIVAKPATCTEQATVTINCAECGQEITHITGEALGHSMDEGVVTKEPTCTATGVMTYTCTLCEETQKDEISATGHTYVDGACKDCGEVEPAVETYVKTDLAGIAPQQKVIITVTKQDGNVYALYSGNGTDSAPIAVEVTVIGESIETEKESIYWNISNDNGTLTIYPHGTTDKWLYCTDTNNGVRVGTNTNKAFIIDETGYLKHTFTNRYLGVYNTQDWRCYTSHTTANIANQTLAFYVLECDHANTEEVAEKDATCTEVGYTAGVRCKDCGAIVSGCEEIAAKDHSYNAVVTAPTCTEGGYTTHTCSVCQDSYKDSQTEAAGHKDGDSNNICDICETELENTQPSEPAETVTALSYMFSGYTAGTQYAQGEEHTLDEVVTLTINGAHLNTQIRLYAGSNAVFTSTKVIDSIVVKAGYKEDTLNVYGSTDGKDWTLISAQKTTSTYTDYTFDMPADCKYVKLESVGAQIRVSEMTINVVESGTTEPETPGTTECAHANTTTTSTATCTEAGVETVTCNDCGATVSSKEIPALGHNFVDGVCANGCGATESTTGSTKYYQKVTSAPADWSGTYLIVYEDGSVAFDGGLSALDAVGNTISVTIENDAIVSDEKTDAAAFTIDENGYIKSVSGYYIGQTSDANGLKSSNTAAYSNTLAINTDGSVNIISGKAYLRYNATSGQERFRYYKSGTYTSQKAICLYKLVEE